MVSAWRLTALVGLVSAVIGGAAMGVVYLGQQRPDLAEAVSRVAALVSTPAPPPAPPPAPITVSTAAAVQQDVKITLSGIGTVQAYNTVAVKSRVDGEIIQVLFQEGQDVKPGDPLAVIDPRPYQAQLLQQQAARAKDMALLRGARLDLARYQDLVRKDFASRQQVDQQQALVDQDAAQEQADEAQIAYAQTQLAYTVIRSPIEGRCGIRQIDQGNIVHAADNSPIVVITQLRPISVIFTLAAGSVAAGRLKPGETHVPVEALAADGQTKLDEGTVVLVDNQVDQTTGTIKLKATFPNANLNLWPGNFVDGRIVVGDQPHGVTVPVAALRHGPRGDFVWLVQDGRAKLRTVTAGQADGGRVLILHGLDGGEQVVIDGQYRLEANSHVEVIHRAAGG